MPINELVQPAKEEIDMGSVKVELGEERSKQVRHYQKELEKERGEVLSLTEAVERLTYAGYSRFLAGRKYRKSDKGQKSIEKAQRRMAKERKSLKAKAKPAAKPKAKKKATPKNGAAVPHTSAPAQAQAPQAQ